MKAIRTKGIQELRNESTTKLKNTHTNKSVTQDDQLSINAELLTRQQDIELITADCILAQGIYTPYTIKGVARAIIIKTDLKQGTPENLVLIYPENQRSSILTQVYELRPDVKHIKKKKVAGLISYNNNTSNDVDIV